MNPRLSRSSVAILASLCLAMVSAGAVRADDADEEEDTRPPERPSRPTPPRDPNLPYLFEIGGRLGYTTVPIRGGVNPFGLGIGGRFGFNVRGFYLGASAVDFQGGSDVGATDQAWLLGAELGYGFRIGRFFTIRPQLGVGDTLLTHTEPTVQKVDVVTTASGGGGGGSGGGVSTTVNNLYVQPGLLLMLASTNFFVGVDFDSLIVPGITYGPPPAQATTWVTYSAEGQLGFRL